MPAATRRKEAAVRSESGYSRRFSFGSRSTANGVSSVFNPAAVSASADDHHHQVDAQSESESDNEPTMSRANTKPVSRHRASSCQQHTHAHSSSHSEHSPVLFNNIPHSESSTLHKSPPTSHDDAASSHATVEKHRRSPLRHSNYNYNSMPPRRELLTPDTPLTPSRRSDAADYLDASRRLSNMTMSSSRAPSRASSRGSRSSRLLAPASVLDFGGSVRGSHQSQSASGTRYASSYIEPRSLRSPSNRDTLRSPPTRIHHRDSDRVSISSRTTARKPASVISHILDADTQVYPGTRIRKYIEPQLNDAMRDVISQFFGHTMHDHTCNAYPITVFVGASARDTGSIIQPHVSGAVSLYFAPAHPKNMASLLPQEHTSPSHIPNPKPPTPASVSRRAELRSAITALHTIYELYRGRACAHVCIDSAYVAKAWATWIPAWERNGWPAEHHEHDAVRERCESQYYEHRTHQQWVYDGYGNRYVDSSEQREQTREGYGSDGNGALYSGRSRRRTSSRSVYGGRDDWLASDSYKDRNGRRGGGARIQYDYSSDEDEYPPHIRRPIHRTPGRRLIDEDLLRELADIRYEFARIERNHQGSAHLYLIDRSNNPADRMARAITKSSSPLLHPNHPPRTQPSISNPTPNLRSSISLPPGHLRRAQPTQLHTFDEQHEHALFDDDVRSLRSARSPRSTRDEYLARQDGIHFNPPPSSGIATKKKKKSSALRETRLVVPTPSEHGVRMGHSIDSRSFQMSSEQDFDMHDYEREPLRLGSPKRMRVRIRSQQGSPESMDSQRSGRRVWGLFENRSTPSLRRAPAPEEPEYEWKQRRNVGAGVARRQQRVWQSTTSNDYPRDEVKKPSFFSRMFGRKK